MGLWVCSQFLKMIKKVTLITVNLSTNGYITIFAINKIRMSFLEHLKICSLLTCTRKVSNVSLISLPKLILIKSKMCSSTFSFYAIIFE
jgi:hypothetical protein